MILLPILPKYSNIIIVHVTERERERGGGGGGGGGGEKEGGGGERDLFSLDNISSLFS